MFSDHRWALLIALSGVVVAAVAADARRHRRLQVKRQEKVAVQTWEGEGGNPAPSPGDHSPAPEGA
jgi:hypothetical protein